MVVAGTSSIGLTYRGINEPASRGHNIGVNDVEQVCTVCAAGEDVVKVMPVEKHTDNEMAAVVMQEKGIDGSHGELLSRFLAAHRCINDEMGMTSRFALRRDGNEVRYTFIVEQQ